jgi:hypothetical protein
MNPAITIWLLDAATWLAILLLLGCAAYALLLVFSPATAQKASGALNRRFSARRAMRPMETPRLSERFFYRHHRWVGSTLLLAVAVFFLAYFLDFPRDTVLAALAMRFGHAPAGVLMDTLEWFFLIANALIAVLALAILFRPSLLKPVENVANRWISTRRALKGLEASHEPVDEFAMEHPRVTGLLILAGVIYVTFGLLVAIR